MTASQINTLVSAASAAIEAGDWATAIRKLLSAKAGLAAKPDQKSDGTELIYDRSAIDALIAQCRQMQSAESGVGGSGGVMQRQDVCYENG